MKGRTLSPCLINTYDMRYDKIYQKLREKYSDEEIAESAMIPADLTEDERKQSDAEILAYRMKKLQEMTDEDRILSDVMRLRFEIERYVKEGSFSFDKTFGHFLAEYLRAVRKSQNELSNDLSLHYTKLSRILNDKDEPNVELAYRLEKHSASLIKAELWWKLVIKKHEFIISSDVDTRKAEHEKVKNSISA